ncbi:hypothetical protein PENSPDRAFT_293998 [Peniophora sp. CONT]|nr:hypothetical protein PENSPDRAFT_293998 [Peniophora sp. CONT]
MDVSVKERDMMVGSFCTISQSQNVPSRTSPAISSRPLPVRLPSKCRRRARRTKGLQNPPCGLCFHSRRYEWSGYVSDMVVRSGRQVAAAGVARWRLQLLALFVHAIHGTCLDHSDYRASPIHSDLITIPSDKGCNTLALLCRANLEGAGTALQRREGDNRSQFCTQRRAGGLPAARIFSGTADGRKCGLRHLCYVASSTSDLDAVVRVCKWVARSHVRTEPSRRDII